jgi:hypothetical protein
MAAPVVADELSPQPRGHLDGERNHASVPLPDPAPATKWHLAGTSEVASIHQPAPSVSTDTYSYVVSPATWPSSIGAPRHATATRGGGRELRCGRASWWDRGRVRGANPPPARGSRLSVAHVSRPVSGRAVVLGQIRQVRSGQVRPVAVALISCQGNRTSPGQVAAELAADRISPRTPGSVAARAAKNGSRAVWARTAPPRQVSRPQPIMPAPPEPGGRPKSAAERRRRGRDSSRGKEPTHPPRRANAGDR